MDDFEPYRPPREDKGHPVENAVPSAQTRGCGPSVAVGLGLGFICTPIGGLIGVVLAPMISSPPPNPPGEPYGCGMGGLVQSFFGFCAGAFLAGGIGFISGFMIHFISGFMIQMRSGKRETDLMEG